MALDAILNQAKVLGEARDEITQLKADLAKYGGHTADCKHEHPVGVIIEGKQRVVFECNCGFNEAKERWERWTKQRF